MAASVNLTPEQRSMRARMGGHARWAKEDPADWAAQGQAALRAKFDEEARETPGLSDAEYARRAEQLYKEHMAGLALASSRARAARAQVLDGAR